MSCLNKFIVSIGIFTTANAAYAINLQNLESKIIPMVSQESHFEYQNEGDLLTRITEFQKVPSVATDTHTLLTAKLGNSGVQFKLQYDAEALKNPKQLMADILFAHALGINYERPSYDKFKPISNLLEGIGNGDFIRNAVDDKTIAETIQNAAEQSPTAKARILRLQLEVLKTLQLTTPIQSNLEVSANYMNEILADLTARSNAAEKTARAYLKKQEAILKQWRQSTQALEKSEAMELKLNDLLLNNDRRGVRQLLETYLPWPVMEPSEIRIWKQWLEAIEHPDSSKSVIAYRGVSYKTDRLFKKQTAEGESLAFMSTVLTQNQGSYNRRLRSLSVNRINNGDSMIKWLLRGAPASSTILDQLATHAGNARASSFLSFTLDMSIANNFSAYDNVVDKPDGTHEFIPRGGTLVVKMDSRRLFPNVQNRMGEVEYLAPLIIFPDEVLVYHEGSFSDRFVGKQGMTLQEFKQSLKDKYGISVADSQVSTEKTMKQVNLKTDAIGDKYFNQFFQGPSSGNVSMCSKVFQ